MDRKLQRVFFVSSILSLALFLPLSAAVADDAIEYKENIVYGKGGDQELLLDLARPKTGKGPFPAIIAIHGGSWRRGNKASFRPFIKTAAKKGYVAITVSYRFAPKYKFPAQIEDVKCAVRWLRANAKKYNINPDKIGSFGASAGGHLALLLGLMDKSDGLEGKGGHGDHSSKVQAVVNFFGPTDYQGEINEYGKRILSDFLGGTKEENPKAYKVAAPVTYVSKNDAPVQTHHGTADRIVPYDQALRLQKALKKSGVVNELHTVKDGRHGWRGKELTQSIESTFKWFDRYLKSGTKSKAKSLPKEKRDSKLY
ncbi:MAG: alpha/beta hydrolase [Planctomycetota bacterium]|nr:alpha/beta hydrolase [Planctomycetota bacterium]